MCKGPRKAKTLFLSVLEEADAKGFLDFVAQHKSKKSPFTFEELLKSLSQNELVTTWENILKLVQNHAPRALGVDADSSSENQEMSTEILSTAVLLASLTFEQSSKITLCLLQMAVFLHGVLLRFSNHQDPLQNAISLLCEQFWIHDIDGKEELMSNTVIYVLKRSLQVKGKKIDVRRVWLLKDAIALQLSKGHPDKEELHLALKRCAASPIYLSSIEGVKFIEFLLSHDLSLVEMIHYAIKRHLPNCSMKHCSTYGSIYHSAWLKAVKQGSLPLKEKLELFCIQDIMYHAIHVQRNRPRSLVPFLRKLLAVLHEKKKDFRVLRMLRDLYEPILWRALKDSNANVRANAAQLFFDVFPLEDPDFNIADTEIELQRQLILVKDLLVDEYPVIRSISASGVCNIMNFQWELLSTDIVKTYFKILVEELSCDSSSADVRCSVVKGMKTLLENHIATPTLKIYLPRLIDLFHDVSEKVRSEFCKLLLVVQKMRFIKYWEIVPVDHLLARLEEDRAPIAKLIVELMYNSYLPVGQLEDYWLCRCLELIKTEQRASKVFFAHLPEFVEPDAIVKFMIISCRTLNLYVRSKTNAALVSSVPPVPDNKENNVNCNTKDLMSSFDADGPIGFDNHAIVSGLLDALAFLWIGIHDSLEKPENKLLKKELIARFSKYMPSLLMHFEDSEIWQSVYFLCCFVPPNFIPKLAGLCLSRLTRLPEKSTAADFGTLLVCMCNQGKTDDILRLIRQWIHYGLTKEEPNQSKSVKLKRKKRKMSGKTMPKPILAAKYLEMLIDKPECRPAILKNSVKLLETIVDEIQYVKRIIKDVKTSLNDEKESIFLFKVFSTLTKLGILLQREMNKDPDAFYRKLVAWANEDILIPRRPLHPAKCSKPSSKKHGAADNETMMWRTLASDVCKDILNIGRDLILMGVVLKDAADYVQFVEAGLASDFGPALIAQSASLICQLSENGKFLADNIELRDGNQALILPIFAAFLKAISDDEFMEDVAEADKVKDKLKDLLLSQHKLNFVSKSAVEDLYSKALHCAITIVRPLVCSNDSEEVALPHTSSMLMFMTESEELMKSFIGFLLTWIQQADLTDVLATCYLVVKAVLNNKSIQKKAENEIKQLVDAFGASFESAPDEEKCIEIRGRSQIDVLRKQFQKDLVTHDVDSDSQD